MPTASPSTAPEPVYLDHNATTKVAPEVFEAMLPFLRGDFGNPSSGHALGRRAAEAMARARAQVAAAIGAQPDEIVFTSGGTEADNLAVRGVAEATPRRHLLTSRIEHPAIVEPCRWLSRRGFHLDWLGVDERGVVRVDDVRELLAERTALVSVMLANNETGALQPVREVAALASHVGAVSHSDAAQALGKIPIDVEALGVDLLTLVGHKAYAPKGVGALYVREGTALSPLLLGGGQEGALRPGTENVPYAVGFGVACELISKGLTEDARRMLVLREQLFGELASRVPGLARTAPAEGTLPNTLSVRFPGVHGAVILERAPGVCASTGSACHEGVDRPSAVLMAMGLAEQEALSTVRLSLGRGTTEGDVERAATDLAAAWRSLATR